MRGRRTQKSPGKFELLLTQHPQIRSPSYRTRCEPKPTSRRDNSRTDRTDRKVSTARKRERAPDSPLGLTGSFGNSYHAAARPVER